MQTNIPPAGGAAPALPQGRLATSLAEALAEPLMAGPDVAEAVINLRDLAGMDFAGRAPSGHELIMDTDPGAGGADLGFHPVELLLVALAGCTAMDVLSILRKKRQVITDYRVRVAGVQQAQHPRVYTQIVVQHIVSGPAVDPVAVARSVELSATRYCPVNAMLARACEVTHQFRIVPTAGPGAL
jgi:putative redox protein